MFGFFLAFFAFWFSILRAYAPKLTLLSIFGSVILDVFCSYGPLFPVSRYTLPNSIVISTAAYAAIALVVTILVFPETTNHMCMRQTIKLVDDLKRFMELQNKVLSVSHTELAPESSLLAQVKGMKAATVMGIQRRMWCSCFRV